MTAQVWDGAPPALRGRPGMAARTLTVGSMSKSHAMTGSRLGWVAGPEAVIAEMIQLATHTTYGVPGSSRRPRCSRSTSARRRGDVAAPFRRRRDVLMDRLGGQQVLRATPPEGAMYVMVDVRATGITGTGFAEALLEESRSPSCPAKASARRRRGMCAWR
jgi:arginine:pyruvate transaminase